MRKTWRICVLLLLLGAGMSGGEDVSVELEHLTWIEAEKALASVR